MKKEEKIEKIKEAINQGKIIEGKTIFQRKDFKIVWWGLGELYKWRWYGNHIDLGCISLYGLKSKWWIILAWIIWPLRKYYQLVSKLTMK